MDVTVRHWTLLIVVVVALGGCHTTDPTIELLENELRWMEDQLYTMDRQLDRSCQQLSSAKNSNRALSRELTDMKKQRSGGGTSEPSLTPADSEDNLSPPAVDVPDVDPDSLEIPRVELGPEANNDAPPTESEPPRLDESLDLNEFTRNGDVDVKVARISLNSRLTGGYDFDGKQGDEGVLLVIEPQNSSGQYVPLPGHLEVEVTDPSRRGPEARLARWEFETSETVPLIRKSLLGQGMHLQLPWPGHLPSAEKLLVKVKFTPPTGETLSTERQIRVDLIPRRPEFVPTQPAGLPDQFVPTASPRLGQLMPERSMAAPAAPSVLPAGRREKMNRNSSGPAVPNTATRRNRRSARILRPQWTPYR